ncbi:MAG: GNAT family N-acetyltransferase, partial [Planctomycetota bacterium]
MTTVRPATSHDAERLRHVHVDSWRAAYRGLVPDDALEAIVEKRDAERYRKMVEDPGTPRAGSWVVEASEEVVGFAHFREATDDDLDGTHGEIPLFYLLEAS